MRRLYDGCLYTFSTTNAYISEGLSAGSILSNTKVVVPNTDRVLAYSPVELIERMKHAYPEMLRASLLVRAVSHMENYLVDLLNEVASRTLVPFKLQDKIVSFSQAQLLSFDSSEHLRAHLIQAECRALSGKGFKEFEKYFKRRFNIAFSQGPVMVDEVEGIYARRHLLVHAGGVIDKHFQRRFSPEVPPGQPLDISEEYFLNALGLLESLAEYCALRIETLFPKNEDPIPPPITQFVEEHLAELSILAKRTNPESPLLIIWFASVFRTKELLEAHFSEEAFFKIDDESHLLLEILAGKKQVGERAMQWLVCGEKSLVGPYIAYLEYLSRKGVLEEFDKHSVPKRASLMSSIGVNARVSANKRLQIDAAALRN